MLVVGDEGSGQGGVHEAVADVLSIQGDGSQLAEGAPVAEGDSASGEGAIQELVGEALST